MGVVDVLGMFAAAGGPTSFTPESWAEAVSACVAKLQAAYEAEGFVFVPVRVHNKGM